MKWVRDARYAVTGKQFDYSYNQYGQKVAEKNLNDVVTSYTYDDSWGNLTQVVQDPDNTSTGYVGLKRTTEMTYDVAGRILTSTDPMNRQATFSYNSLGQPLSAHFAATATTSAENISYYYGTNGRTESVTDGRGTTRIAYETGNDSVSSVTDPITGTVSYTYLPTGERRTVSLPNDSKVFTYHYSNVNSLQLDIPTVLGNQGVPVIMPDGDPNKVSLRLGAITDEQNRMVDVYIRSQGQLSGIRYGQTFNSGGWLNSYLQTENFQYWPRGGYDFELPWLGRTSTYLNNSDGQRLLHGDDYDYDSNGRRKEDIVSTQPLDAQGKPAKNANGTPFYQSRTEQYGYDPLSRLTSVNYGDGQTQTYSFDAMGNRTAKTDSVSGNESYGFNAANMLTTRNGNGYSNDANGNTLSDADGRVNTWDSQNRLVKVVCGSVTSEFTYGSDGLRRRKSVTAANGEKTVTDYVLDGQNMMQEVVSHYASNGSLLATPSTVSYLQGPQGPLYHKSSSAADPTWYVYDGLGSVVGEVGVTSEGKVHQRWAKPVR